MIGIEKEMFLFDKKNKLVIEPSKHGFEVDNIGVLVEIRGEPKKTIEDAMASLLAKELVAEGKAQAHGYSLKALPFVKLDDKEILEVTKKYMDALEGKFRDKTTSKVTKDAKISIIHAGLHIHFSREQEVNFDKLVININVLDKTKIDKEQIKEKGTIVVPGFIDMVSIIKKLDYEFKNDIAKAGRTASSYEIKPHGFEYRSLPANVDMTRVASVCSSLSSLFL